MHNKTRQRPFDHVLIIMFENQYREYVMANAYFNRLASQGLDMQNFHGVMHPSQTNYIASIAGELCNMTDDDPPPQPLTQRTIVDLIEEADTGLTWKAYMDSYIPQSQLWSTSLTPANDFPYVIKHNPFSSFKNIQDNPQRWQKIVNEEQFWRDVITQNLPNYAWFTPNMWNDGHYTVGTHVDPKERAPALVDQAAQWLEGFFADLRFPGPDSRLPDNTLVVVTFDESDFMQAFDANKKYTYDGPNQIYTVLLGDGIKPGVRFEAYNHYSLLRTIEKNFNLNHLGKNDACANHFQFLWQREFSWQAAVDTPLQESHEFSAVALDNTLYLLSRNQHGALICNRWTAQDGWNDADSPDINTGGTFSLTTQNNTLLLCYSDDNEIKSMRYSDEAGWVAGPSLSHCSANTLVTLELEADGGVLMVWRNNKNELHSARLINDTWQDQQRLGHSSEGDLALNRIGPSVYLIIEQVDDKSLQAVSYNTADYNTTVVANSQYSGPQDNTTKFKWSPSLTPVARFGACAYAGTPKELEPVTLPYTASAPIAMAELDGVLHLVHPGNSKHQLSTETFSVAGILTPLKPVSYKASDEATTSNGYGTLAEAGWSRQTPVHGTHINDGSGLTMARIDNKLVLLYNDGQKIKMISGSYKKHEID